MAISRNARHMVYSPDALTPLGLSSAIAAEGVGMPQSRCRLGDLRGLFSGP